MASFSRKEMEEAFANYGEVNDKASETGDWAAWTSKFTEDAHYVEHAFGEFHGQEAIREWITQVMAPYPHMTFPMDWYMIDEERGWILFQCQNRLEHPQDPSGEPFQFPTWSLIKYAGNNLWSYEEDNYNPEEASEAIRAWLKAGGTLASPPRVQMKSRRK